MWRPAGKVVAINVSVSPAAGPRNGWRFRVNAVPRGALVRDHGCVGTACHEREWKLLADGLPWRSVSRTVMGIVAEVSHVRLELPR